ncbi:MAG: hypothetical protein J6N54_05310 [Bacteroidales bacterium]|nr:hypothetical protein [Bacteroidales bacterium]
MNKLSGIIAFALTVIGLGSAVCGCSMIDDGRDDCFSDLTIAYEMRLVTNRQPEIDSVLSAPSDIYVKKALEDHLSGIFSDYGRGLELSFYAPASVDPAVKETKSMEAVRKEFPFTMDPGDWFHTAMANGDCSKETLVSRDGYQYAESHKAGLFSGRKSFTLVPGNNPGIEVGLYMVNSGTALVVETSKAPEIDPSGITIYVTGFADGFNVADSVFTYPSTFYRVNTVDLPVSEGTEKCYAAVHFPSRDPRIDPTVGVRSVTETVEPFRWPETPKPIWEWVGYVKRPDGKTTETVLGIRKPLRAGQLKILKVFVDDDGRLLTDDPEVAVSVNLDWQPGLDFEPFL